MSNEIRNFNSSKYISAQNMSNKANFKRNEQSCAQEENTASRYNEAISYLDTLGHAQVNMDKRKSNAQAVREYMKDPILGETHTDFCDKLMEERNLPLEEALQITDEVFEVLGKEDTYK